MNDENHNHTEDHDHMMPTEHEQDATAESWHGHEPPIDDFSDPASEEATVSEEADSAEEVAVPVEISRRSPVTMIAVAIVGGALLIGAVVYWQFGSMLHATPQTPRPISITQNATPKPLPSDIVSGNGISQNGMAQPTPPAVAPQPPPVPPVAEVPTTASPSTQVAANSAAPSAATTPAAVSSAVPAPVPVDPASIPVTNAPAAPVAAPVAMPVVVASSTPAATPAPQQPVVAAAAPEQSSAKPAATGSNDNRVAELTARVDALQKALAQATQELTQIGDKVSGVAAAPAGASGDVNERIARLEQTIAQLQQQKAASPAKAGLVATDADNQTVVAHKKRHSKAVSAKAHRKAVAQETKSSGRWVLRAASPDEAWVSRTADSHDLQPVHVGDTLPGIGRIKSIDQVGDSWVVRGTSGSVR